MSAYFNVNRNRFMCLAIAVLCLSFCFSGETFGIEPLQQDALARIVVLDPGHGGHNIGAAGPENLLEKLVTMKFSRILAEQLKNRYKVLLTRTDDYDVPFEDRLAKANHARADLLISVHAGGSMLHNIGGISIFYYEKPQIKELSPKASPPDSIAAKQLEPWEYIKPGHIERSRYFAELLKMQLLEDQKDLKITITGAPLVIAAGADMPALLIEIGYVTNPGDAQSLNNNDILYSYAKSIVKAIDAFFSDKLHL